MMVERAHVDIDAQQGETMNIFDWLFPGPTPLPTLPNRANSARVMDGRTAYIHPAPGCWVIQESAPHGVCMTCGSPDVYPVQWLIERLNAQAVPHTKSQEEAKKPRAFMRPMVAENLALYLTRREKQ